MTTTESPTIVKPFSPARWIVPDDAPVGNGAFPVSELQDLSGQAIETRTTTYLAEYRWELALHDYALIHERGHLRGEFETETLERQAERCIVARREGGDTTYREVADLRGIRALDQQLETADTGDILVDFSPPELGHKYCGEDYGFVRVGRVANRDQNGSARVDINLYRVKDTDIANYNRAFNLLTGESVEYSTPEEFIESPRVLPRLADPDIEGVLSQVFGFYVPQGEQDRKELTLKLVESDMQEFVGAVQTRKPARVQERAFDNLEWNATMVWKHLQVGGNLEAIRNNSTVSTARQLVEERNGRELPAVQGTCGLSGRRGGLSSGGNSLLNSEKFECPRCKMTASGPVGNRCPSCKLTKEMAQILGYNTC